VNDESSNCLARTAVITQLVDYSESDAFLIDHELFRHPIGEINRLIYLLWRTLTLAPLAQTCEIIAGLPQKLEMLHHLSDVARNGLAILQCNIISILTISIALIGRLFIVTSTNRKASTTIITIR
jgi:hypothetical protein